MCKTCQDSGWVRQEGLEFYEEGFGKLIPCPDCRQDDFVAHFADEEEQEKESEPRLIEEVFWWEKE